MKNTTRNGVCTNCRSGDTEHCLKTEKRIMGNSSGKIENVTIACISTQHGKDNSISAE